MCKVADAAMAMVNKSIEMQKATNDERYYLDTFAIHKLLYLCQYEMEVKYGLSMFDEKITAHYCGPYIDGLDFLTIRSKGDLFKEPFPQDVVLSLTTARLDIIDQVLKKWGHLSNEELVVRTRNTTPYKKRENEIEENKKPDILNDDMKVAPDLLIAEN